MRQWCKPKDSLPCSLLINRWNVGEFHVWQVLKTCYDCPPKNAITDRIVCVCVCANRKMQNQVDSMQSQSFRNEVFQKVIWIDQNLGPKVGRLCYGFVNNFWNDASVRTIQFDGLNIAIAKNFVNFANKSHQDHFYEKVLFIFFCSVFLFL